jgi:CheY-like chemotaxis protein
MPVMDGFGFLEEIIKFPQTIEKQCAVVMLSSSDNPNDIKRAMNFEVVIDFFTKPLRIEMIEKLAEKGNL